MHVQGNLRALRVAVPYIRAYKGRVFVVKLGGQLCEPGRVMDNLVDQLALLYQVGIRVVVVHGGGPQASALGARLGATPDIFAGRRITNTETLEVTKMAFAGTVNTNLVAAFRRIDVPAIGMSGVDAGLVTVRKRPPQRMTDPSSGETREIDFGHVGDVTEIRVDGLCHLLDGDFVPVICSLAADTVGNVMNVNADTVAARIAVALGAAKYFLVTNVDGVLRDPRDPATLQSYLDLEQLDELIRTGVIGGGMLPKLAACTAALRGGVSRVHIINGTVTDTLLGEVFTNEGCGTLLVEKRENAVQAVETAPVTL
ncbi:MAG: acetylglutamate kinase [Planctomycetota bacterium]